MHNRLINARSCLWLLLAAVLGGLCGCTHPIGAHHSSSRRAYAQFTASALHGDVSAPSRIVLHRYNLGRAFEENPEAALKQLHDYAWADDRRDTLFALAELNYFHGDQLASSVLPSKARGARDFHLAAAVYAYWFLFGDGPGDLPSPFDREFRLACDIYNFSVAKGFAATNGKPELTLQSGERKLLAGDARVKVVQADFKWSFDEIEQFVASDQLVVHGLSVRNREHGLGAAIVGVGKVLDKHRFPRRIAASMFLRPAGDFRNWKDKPLEVSLELYEAYAARWMDVGNASVPLEADTTAPIAFGLNDAAAWKLGSEQFFSTEERIRTGIHFMEPYDEEKIPVVFVHGTASSPVWWAEMWNTLRADKLVRQRFQFWMFVYNSGKPLPVSAENLRSAIDRQLTQLDPKGTNQLLRQMVVVGHSQGGLLTKLTAVDTGNRLWNAVSKRSLDSLEVEADIRNDMRRHFFYKPVPAVKRVVFIATPHRGSYLAGNFVRGVVRRFTKLPADILGAPARLKKVYEALQLPEEMRRVPTSVDGMSPKNPWLLALADTPVAPGVKSHSIIAIRGDAQPPEGGDGVVKYVSAHVPGVESELIVRSGHTCQDKPATIEEVRRILFVHFRGVARERVQSQSSSQILQKTKP